MQQTGQDGDGQDRVPQHPLPYRHDRRPGAGPFTVPMLPRVAHRATRPPAVTVRVRRGRFYSRTVARARIGVVGACRIRCGHLKALPVS
ncbi:hypothetical protein TNCT6_34750 [Streptomyces sp. 6-11-2]|nr:hypothetical protein TNCT6_34750 [Streptomyces sp. 6-11-2]